MKRSAVFWRHTGRMTADTSQVERTYADDVLAELRKDGRVRIDRAEVVGSFPDTIFEVIFRVTDRPCVYGVHDRIWDEKLPEDFDSYQSATYTVLRWIEALDCGELPHRCAPDPTGVTWLNLWEDC
jgi:hypothetical protein